MSARISNNSTPIRVLGIVGSLRGGSHNARLMEVARRALPADAVLETWGGLGDLPHYNEDIDTPETAGHAAGDLRAAIASADVLLLVTPEYNGTIPGVLKNAVDWASRPAGVGALKGKPAAAIGSSTGQFGGVWAQADLRRSLGIAGARVIDAEFAVPRAAEAFVEHDGEVSLADESVLPALAELLESLVEEGRKNRSAREMATAEAA
ncbi:MAG: NAD(P)H-dependent oxidoreductase [Actinobacteria bacterium]|nr:NAD(P)H-dependent oxidoreductase [Actinomycetota bacterium]